MIVGLGKTGYSCAQFLMRRGIPFSVVDDSDHPVYLARLEQEMPGISVGRVTAEVLQQAQEIILSPGVPLTSPAIQHAISEGVSVTGDIAMFARETTKPLVVITGSNGKSTVTDLVGFMAGRAGLDVGVGGNIGIPALDILEENHDVSVLEVSSYQLEVADSLKSKVATVLNLTPDHLDRYQNTGDYYATKARIYQHCEVAVVNRGTEFDFPIPQSARQVSFGLDKPSDGNFGLVESKGQIFLCQGDKSEVRNLVSTGSLTVKGQHNWLNVLAALAIGESIGMDMHLMIEAVQVYTGLAHRCEWIGNFKQVDFYNDSKATNPASTLAAIEGFSGLDESIYLVLGGVAKDADFSQLADVCFEHVKKCLIFGQDRNVIDAAIKNQTVLFETLDDVVDFIAMELGSADLVLFSPACASLDQYENYEHRGSHFKQLVKEKIA